MREPRLLRVNGPVARALGLDAEWLASAEGVAMLAGNCVPEGASPIAQGYAGHQFGGFSPQLGDGRAILLGEVIAPSGARFDLQLKGSGPTPWSRRGDGRAALGPVLREYIVSEAMAALGIPTTRALAAVTTGEHVLREEPLPGAVLARVAASHVRVGTFQFFAARGDTEAVRVLADYVIDRHYPQARETDNAYVALLDLVIARQAELIARWMHVGFIHGVMNTDNMSIAGETIDYGPCAFMDDYNAGQVYSSIDHQGRYAFANQPAIAQWNLARFAETLLPLIASDQNLAVKIATDMIERFPVPFVAAYAPGLTRKIGITNVGVVRDDVTLVEDLLGLMAAASADYTLTFRTLADAETPGAAGDEVTRMLGGGEAAAAWLSRWRTRLAAEPGGVETRCALMRAANPLYIARNHLVEEALAAATANGDLHPFDELVDVLQRPFDDRPGKERFAMPPRADQIVHATYCGT